MAQTPEVVLQVRLQHPTHLASCNHLMKRCQGTMSALPWPSAKGTRQEVLLVDGGHYLSSTALERPVIDTRNTQGAFLLLAGLRDINPPDCRRAISLTVHGLKHGFNPSPKALLRLGYVLAIHPRRRVFRYLLQRFVHTRSRVM